jgi:DNA helicase II / ATP-dependent DNA helicase PcrA
MDRKNLEDELLKEIQLNAEKEKLDEVKTIIKEEMQISALKRKELADYIQEYRKNVIEEYRDDEDKVAEYFDHERFIKEEAFKTIERRLKELVILQNSPYFGKVNFVDKDFDEEETIYIGRFGLTPERYYEPIVVDWRAPVSALFYAGKLGDITYNAPQGVISTDIKSKRQFIIKKGALLGMFDSDVDVKDEILQMVLSSNTSEKLKDIIMTIQAEQDNIIRQPKDKTVVVNGTAGSGKTTIALHRVAYLLYNYRESLKDKVLILGPNSIFMEYISTVLPSLGETGVRQTTFTEFALALLNIDSVFSFKDYMENILQGNSDFIKNIIRKNSRSFIDELDKLIKGLNSEYFKIKDVVFLENIIVDSGEIKKMFNEYFIELPLFRRSKKIKRILFSRIKDARDEKLREIEKEHKKTMESMSSEQLKLEKNNLEFIRRNKIRDLIREVIKVKEELRWIDNPEIVDIYEEFLGTREFIWDDLAPMLYLKIKLEGFRFTEEVKHIVIDEAQDYSELQFIVIKELTKCQSMTVVGDSNQRLIPIEERIPMLALDEIMPNADIQRFELNKSYRSTKEIMEYAGRFIKGKGIVPLVRKGTDVIEESYTDEQELVKRIVRTLKDFDEKGYESAAVVCRTLKDTERIGRLIKTYTYINLLNTEDISYNGGKVVIPSYFAKGMEFDAVIIVDQGLAEKNEEDRLMYVMSTRALHELHVYKLI